MTDTQEAELDKLLSQLVLAGSDLALSYSDASRTIAIARIKVLKASIIRLAAGSTP